jgi:hypothetical protein
MANNFELITKYLPNVVDTVFAQESKTALFETGGKFIDINFSEAGYVKLMSMLMDGLSDYHRAGHGYEQEGYGKGSVSTEWEIFRLMYDRGTQFKVDNADNEEQAGQIVANLLTEFVRTKVIPEVDAVRFSRIAEKATTTLGNLVSETIEANKIIAGFNTAFEWQTENGVPSEDQIIFVSPKVMSLIRNTTELNKYIAQSDFTSGGVTFTLPTYDGRPIVQVPSSRFFTNVITGANGYFAGANSKIINYIVASKKAIVPIVKIEKSKVFGPDVVQDFDGYKINFRMYHDLIIPKNKVVGAYVSVSNENATTKTNKLMVDVKKSGDKHIVDTYFSAPAGLHGKLVHGATAFNVGTEYEDADEIFVDVPFTKLGATEYFALLDNDGKAIAVSQSVTMPV